MSPCPVGRLPIVLIEIIVDINLADFAYGARDGDSGRGVIAGNVHLARLCRVSTVWQAIAKPRLYNTLRLNSSKPGKRLMRRLAKMPVPPGLAKCVRIVAHDNLTASDILKTYITSIAGISNLHVRQQTHCEASIASRSEYGLPLPLPQLTHLTYERGPCTHLAQLLSHLPHLVNLKVVWTYCESAQSRVEMPQLLARLCEFETMLPVFVPGFGSLPDCDPPACRLRVVEVSGTCGKSVHLAWLLQSSIESLREMTIDYSVVGILNLMHLLINIEVITLVVNLFAEISSIVPMPAPELCFGFQQLAKLTEIHIVPQRFGSTEIWPLNQILALRDMLPLKKVTVHLET